MDLFIFIKGIGVMLVVLFIVVIGRFFYFDNVK